MSPERLWIMSCWFYRHHFIFFAKFLKLLNFLIFRTVLPFECVVSKDIRLRHRGMGTVVHPNTTIGRRVQIAHNVTVAAGNQDKDSHERVFIEDGVVLGAGSFVGARQGGSLTIGRGATIGAHAVVTRDVPPGAKMKGPKAEESK